MLKHHNNSRTTKFYFFLLTFLLHSESQLFYFDEDFTGSITNGSLEFPFQNLSEVFSLTSKESVTLFLLGNLTCNDTYFNDFGLSLMFFFKNLTLFH